MRESQSWFWCRTADELTSLASEPLKWSLGLSWRLNLRVIAAAAAAAAAAVTCLTECSRVHARGMAHC